MKKQFFTLAVMSIMSSALLAQVQSYTVEDITFEWEDFSTYDQTTELMALAGEDEVYPLVIPFDFKFFNNTYTEIFASINGNASFGQSYQGLDFNRENLCEPKESLYDPTREQDAANPDNFIAVYWDDLFVDPTCDGVAPTTPKFVYRTIGTTPNRELIISWENFYNSGADPCALTPLDQFVSAQLRLKETSNEVEVHINNNTLPAYQPTISVENIDGTYAAYAACGPNGESHEYKAYRFVPSDEAPPVDTSVVIGYCTANGVPCNSDFEAITEVTVGGDNGGFTNTTGCDFYGDYSDEYVVFMTPGIEYAVTVYGNAPGFFAGMAAVYVDWNEDFDFDDADELAAIGSTAAEFSGQPFTSFIVPPLTATSGKKRMRVRTTSGSPSSCGFNANGEVEDYSIIIGTPPPCVTNDSPVDGASDKCQSTLLQWSGDSTSIDGYYVYFGETGSPLVKVDSIGDRAIQEYLASELLVNTSYDWKIVPFSAEGTAILCDTSSFTTSPNMDPTVLITVDGVDVISSVVEVCNWVDVLLSGVESQGTFSSGINSANWTGTTANLDATNTLDVIFTGDSINKLFFYTLTIADDNGCTASQSVALHTNEAEAGTIMSAISFVCENDSLKLYVSGNSGSVIDWEISPDNIDFFSLNLAFDTIYASITSDTYYRALVQDASTCTDTTPSFKAIFTPSPTGVVVTQSTDTLLATPGDELITWYKVGSPDEMVSTGSFYVPERAPADYYAVYTNEEGCSSAPSNVLTYDWQVGVDELSNNTRIALYPNPANNWLKISTNDTEQLQVTLLDVAGRVSKSWDLKGSNTYELSLDHPAGVYFVQFKMNDVIVKQEQLIIQ